MGGPSTVAAIDPLACEGCGVCVHFCPERVIDFAERRCGEWFVSRARSGPMVHARLGIAAENSGKLVSTVRREARRVAVDSGSLAILSDGRPGIGCPVIAAVTGATGVLVVAEPTVSGTTSTPCGPASVHGGLPQAGRAPSARDPPDPHYSACRCWRSRSRW